MNKKTKKGSPHKMDATDKVKHARKKYKKFIQKGLSPIKKILKGKKSCTDLRYPSPLWPLS